MQAKHFCLVFLSIFVMAISSLSCGGETPKVPAPVGKVKSISPTSSVEEETQPKLVETVKQEKAEAVVPTEDAKLGEGVNEPPSPDSDAFKNGLGSSGEGVGFGGPRGAPGPFGRRTGVSKPNHERVSAALQWLADHQNKEGYWSPDEYHKDSIRAKDTDAKVSRNIEIDEDVQSEEDIGDSKYRMRLTGLALLAFIGDGNTHEIGDYKPTIKRACLYLIANQDADGCFGGRESDDYLDGQAICTAAICEIYAETDAIVFQATAQLAVDFILMQQQPKSGWKSGAAAKGCNSVTTAWMTMALYAAQKAKLKGDFSAAFEGANAWFDRIETNDDQGNLVVGFERPGDAMPRPSARAKWASNSAMNGCDGVVRVFSGKHEPTSSEVAELGKAFLGDLPLWRSKGAEGKLNAHKIDFTYWYFGSLAAFQIGGTTWEIWENTLMEPVLLKHQRGWHPVDLKSFDEDLIVKGSKTAGIQGRHLLDEHGSWDALDPWSVHGGRVYATAINCLTLEVYYRYARVGE